MKQLHSIYIFAGLLLVLIACDMNTDSPPDTQPQADLNMKLVEAAKGFLDREICYTNDYINGGVEDHFITPQDKPGNVLNMDCTTEALSKLQF